MSTHGFASAVRLSNKLADLFALRRTNDDEVRMYRNFAKRGLADEADLYTGLGEAGSTGALFEKLLRRVAMQHSFKDKDGASTDDGSNDNPNIPAGYTYFLQFIAHDLTKNTSSPTVLAGSANKSFNARKHGLMLESLYGGGPLVDPMLYQVTGKPDGIRSRLRVGKVRETPFYKTNPEPGGCPFLQRDLPRNRQDETRIAPDPLSFVDVAVADPRNDDTPMVSQLASIFHLAHNAIVDSLENCESLKFDENGWPKQLNLFEAARYVLTKTFHQIIIHDLLKKLLSERVYHAYSLKQFRPLVDTCVDDLPLEFSHAAGRACHAMVRKAYVFNRASQRQGLVDALKINSAARPEDFPLDHVWVSQWSQFFKLSKTDPLLSRRIGPSYNDILTRELLFPNGDYGAHEGHVPDSPGGLMLRDLVRGTMGGLQKLSVLREVVPIELQAGSPLLSQNGDWAVSLRAWLIDGFNDFSEVELDSLVSDPPLLFWILFEAMEQEQGLRFGTLGSLILGDTILARISNVLPVPAIKPNSQTLEEIVFGASLPSTMCDLIQFISDKLKLNNARPRFL